jgi:hypothetical protein
LSGSGPASIAFNDMPQATDRRPRTDQRNSRLSSTQQHRNCTHDRQRVLDDRAPAIEWVEVPEIGFIWFAVFAAHRMAMAHRATARAGPVDSS